MDTDVRGGKGYVEFCFSYSYSNCYSILSDWLCVINSHNSAITVVTYCSWLLHYFDLEQ